MAEQDYIKDTPPLEFIADLYDIMFDGDNMKPKALVKDMAELIKQYLAEHKEGHDGK